MRKTKVVVVDDSPAMRALITHTLSRDPGIIVVGQAGDPIEARQVIKTSNPDVITLDIEMPNMCGLDFLEKIMRLRPMPVVMVSSHTRRAADATIKALEVGAVACIAKPTIDAPNSFDDLVEIVRSASHAKIGTAPTPKTGLKETKGFPKSGSEVSRDGAIIAIGSSTGGVEALMTVLSRFPKDGPPVVITQHMPALFTRSFAQRLNTLCAAEVSEAVDGAPLVPGKIYVAPGGDRHLEVAGSRNFWCRLKSGGLVQGHRPSVDVLFSSVARTFKGRAVGVILTGMGRDGANGLLEMRVSGARTFGQNEATSIVYGMPKVAFEIGAVERQLPLGAIPEAFLEAIFSQPDPKGDSHALC